jgi:hypothetical protein
MSTVPSNPLGIETVKACHAEQVSWKMLALARAIEESPKFILCGFEARTLCRRELASCTIDVEGEHGHRRSEGSCLSALTDFGGGLE